MKIIDKKGRLFGVINLIDLVVILFLASLIPLVYIGYKLSLPDRDEVVSVEVTASFEKLLPEVVSNINIGDEGVPSLEREFAKVAKIAEVKKSAPILVVGAQDIEENYGAKDVVVVDDRAYERKDVVLELDMMCKDRAGVLYYDNKPVKIGEKILFSAERYTLRGVVKGIREKK